VSTKILTGFSTCLCALCRVFFNLGSWYERPQGFCELPCITCIAFGNRSAFRFVAGEQTMTRLSAYNGSEFPTEIDRVFNCGVVAKSARWREQMRRIASNKDATALKLFGYERIARDPGSEGEDLGADRSERDTSAPARAVPSR